MAAINLNYQIPAKLAGIYQPRRYKVMKGGRGGGKSHSVARVLLDLGARRPLRILCAREIQKSMRDSVHRLLKDCIVSMGLTGFYEVLDNEIRGVNGTLIIFSGLQSHTVDSIKSYEGVDIVWIEEAQSISKKSMAVLVPTIRKEGSEIWMTMNPDMETDYIYATYCAHPDVDTWLVTINWRDNPWLPAVLHQERMRAARTMSRDDYEWVWEGKPRTVGAGAIYKHEMEAIYAEGRVRLVPYDPAMPVHTVWDLGWNDSMTIGMVQKGPFEARVINYIEDSHRTLNWYATELAKLPYRWGQDFLPHDGRNGNFLTGKTPQQTLQELRPAAQVLTLRAGPVEDGIKNLRMEFSKLYIDKDKCGRLLECMKRYKRVIHQRSGEAREPEHDEFSHGADMMRYLAQALPLMDNTVGMAGGGYKEAPATGWR